MGSASASDVIAALSRARLPVDDEKALQLAVSDVLTGAGMEHTREVKVTGGIIDFIVAPDIGIELKIKGSKRQIYRQVERYCADERLSHIVVASSLPLALPASIVGKPITLITLGRAWL